MFLQQLRSYKLLGVSVFDFVGSFVATSYIGARLGYDPVFFGLVSIPVGVLTHLVMGIETPLTTFYKSDSEHRYHGVIIGGLAGVVSKYAGKTDLTSINVALASGIFSTLYMMEYGHSLPPALKKKLIKAYFKYKRWQNTP